MYDILNKLGWAEPSLAKFEPDLDTEWSLIQLPIQKQKGKNIISGIKNSLSWLKYTNLMKIYHYDEKLSWNSPLLGKVIVVMKF